jgi:hypothetical protein
MGKVSPSCHFKSRLAGYVLMIIKYLTRPHRMAGADLIELVEVERETENSVWVKSSSDSRGRRSAKVSGWAVYHDTWEQARSHLMDIAIKKADAGELALNNANNDLNKIFLLVEPK